LAGLKLKNRRKWGLIVVDTVIAVLVVAFFVTDLRAQMKHPQTVVLKGRIIDLSCGAKGKERTGTWNNVGQDHVMADGSIQKDCATMCLMGGQPAALFSDNKVTAVLVCNPRGSGASEHTLVKYASAPVEVQGYWVGSETEVKAFVPLQLRRTVLSIDSRYGSGGWRDLDCALMHE
jgi:hypothetical protein